MIPAAAPHTPQCLRPRTLFENGFLGPFSFYAVGAPQGAIRGRGLRRSYEWCSQASSSRAEGAGWATH